MIRQLRRLWRHNVDWVMRHFENSRAFDRTPDYWTGFFERVARDSSPVFVLSTGRSGTHLLAALAERVRSVEVHNEPVVELVPFAQQAYEADGSSFEALRTAVLFARLEVIAGAYLRGDTYLETSPRMTFLAPHVVDAFPKARFLHLVREPCQFVTSAIRRGFYDGQYTDAARIVPVREPEKSLWAGWSALQKNAWLWNETNAFIEAFKTQMGPRVMTVLSQGLFSDPDAFFEICDFLEVPRPSRTVIERTIRKPVNAQMETSAFPDPKHWTEDQKGELREIATLACRYGFRL